MINRCNWLIFNVENNTTEADFSPTERRAEIIAEAKGLRALNNLYILRSFGQFYDVNSAYGIDVRLAPAQDAAPNARKSVAESYVAIHDDLDAAIAHAPDLRAKWYVNKMFARGTEGESLSCIKANIPMPLLPLRLSWMMLLQIRILD